MQPSTHQQSTTWRQYLRQRRADHARWAKGYAELAVSAQRAGNWDEASRYLALASEAIDQLAAVCMERRS